MSFNCDGVAFRVALARLRMPRRSNIRSWHLADIPRERSNVRSASQSGTADCRIPIAVDHCRHQHEVTDDQAE